MTLIEFKEELSKHDWFYMMSESPLKYEEGRANHNRLLKIASNSPELTKEFMKQKEIKYETYK